MTGNEKRLVFRDAPDVEFPSIDALMASMAESGRTGARSAAGGIDPGAWAAFERSVDQGIMRTRTGSANALHRDTLAVISRVSGALRARTDGPSRVEAYAACIATIDDARASGQELTTPEAMARHAHAAVVWFSAWHLLGAGLTTSDMMRVLAGVVISQGYERPAYALKPPAAPPPEPAASPTAPLESAERGLFAPAGAWVRARAKAMSRGAEKAWNAALVIARETAKARDQRLKAAKAARDAAPTRLAASGDPAIPNRTDSGFQKPSSIRVNGDRLRSSAFGTWLMLVILSWVALIWGALLSIPIAGPFGVMGAMMGGFVMVPIWASFWGFLGMGAAKASTLAQMGFRAVAEDAPLARTTARLARRLDLPPPQIGTIPAFNAFAMGTDHRYATVAIGLPLMGRLTEDELAAVIGHELGHVVSGDMRKMMLMRTFQNACVWYMLAQGLKQFMRWVICWAAELSILAFSRQREYWADAVGAALTSKEAMIGALRKLDQAPAMTLGERTHARFMFRGFEGAFSTHPRVAKRIAALEAELYLKRLPIKGRSHVVL